MLQLPVKMRDFNESCLQYLRELKVSKKSAFRYKILVVGKESVGKTSIVKHIMGASWTGSIVSTQDNSKSGASEKVKTGEGVTDGIDVHQWIPKNSNVVLNIWDFGGREFYHTTHQFFLSKRTIYMLVFDGRYDLFENKIVEWLNCIQSRSPGETVIIVGTHFDKKSASNQYDKLNEQLEQLLSDMARMTSTENQFKILKSPDGKIFWKICSKIGREFGVHSLIQQLVEEGKKKAYEVRAPPSWLLLREKIITMRKGVSVPIIDRKALRAIAAEVEVFDNHFDLACNLLEDWSEIFIVPKRLHYSADLDSELIIIDPKWMIDVFDSVISLKYFNIKESSSSSSPTGSNIKPTTKITKILSKAITKVKEKTLIDSFIHYTDNVTEYLLSKDELQNRWKEKGYPDKFFPILLDLLQYHFELIAEVEPDQYLTPCLMRGEKEPNIINKFWSLEKLQCNEIFRKYDFPFLPYGFFSRLCVEIIQRDRTTWNNAWHVTKIWGNGLEIAKTIDPNEDHNNSNIDKSKSTNSDLSTTTSSSSSLNNNFSHHHHHHHHPDKEKIISTTKKLPKLLEKTSLLKRSSLNFSQTGIESESSILNDDLSHIENSSSSTCTVNNSNKTTSSSSFRSSSILHSSNGKTNNPNHFEDNLSKSDRALVEIYHPNNSGTNCSLYLRTRGTGKKSGAGMLVLFHHVIMQLLQDYSGLSSRIQIYVGIRSPDPSKSIILSRQDCIGSILLHKTINPELAWLIPEMFPSTVNRDGGLDESERNYIGSKEQFKHEVILDRELGSGISGAVYEGTWLGHHVAIKLPHIDSSSIYRIDDFFQEVELLRSLDHPNVLKFLYRYNNPPVIITEFCGGGDLSHVFQVNTHIPEVLVIRICLDISSALSYLHNHQPPILHGDVRAPNILIKQLDPFAEVTAVLADVGNAQIADPISLTWNDKTTATDMSGFIAIFEQLLECMEAQSDSDSESSSSITSSTSNMEGSTQKKLYNIYNEIKNDLDYPFDKLTSLFNDIYQIHKKLYQNFIDLYPSRKQTSVYNYTHHHKNKSSKSSKKQNRFKTMLDQLSKVIELGDHEKICGVLRVAHSCIPFDKSKRRWVEFSQVLITYNLQLARNGKSAKLQEILEIGFIDVAEPNSGMFLIHFAAEAGQLNCLKVISKMLNTNPNITSNTVSGNSPLHLAVSQGNTSSAQYLIKINADIDCMDNKGQTPLLKATRGAFYDCIQLLLSNNADPNIKSHLGESPLSVAAGFVQTFNPKKDANFRCVILLLCHNADLPYSIDRHSKNVIRSAAQILLSSYWTSVIINPKIQSHLKYILDASSSPTSTNDISVDSDLSLIDDLED